MSIIHTCVCVVTQLAYCGKTSLPAERLLNSLPQYKHLQSDEALLVPPREPKESEAQSRFVPPITSVELAAQKRRESRMEMKERLKDNKQTHFPFGFDPDTKISEQVSGLGEMKLIIVFTIVLVSVCLSVYVSVHMCVCVCVCVCARARTCLYAEQNIRKFFCYFCLYAERTTSSTCRARILTLLLSNGLTKRTARVSTASLTSALSSTFSSSLSCSEV